MSHEIETHGDQAAAIFARTDAWHRLGTTVRGRAFTAEEAMTRVTSAALTATEISNDGVTTIDAPGFATVRSNPLTGRAETLGVVGDAYTPLQNEDHADFLNTLADQSGAVFDTAGSLRGGRQVFVTMKLPETLTVGGIDSIDLNIAALNSHQRVQDLDHPGLGGVRQHPGRRDRQPRLQHRHETDPRRRSTTPGQAGVTVPRADTQANIRGTAWAGYQAVVEYLDHYAPVRDTRHAATARATRLLTSDEPAKTKRATCSALLHG